MCSLCAALGGSRYWTDAAGQAAFARTGKPVTIGQERRRRVALLNRVLGQGGLSLTDWGGNSYVLSDGARRSENIYTLNSIWDAADRMGTSLFDPLDPALIARLEGGT
jgi:hypothetical protein